MTKKKRYKRYSPEFKKEALRRAASEGATDAQVCEELGVSTRQLRRWRDDVRLLGDKAFPGSGRSHDEDLTRRLEVTKYAGGRLTQYPADRLQSFSLLPPIPQLCALCRCKSNTLIVSSN